ncbi:hypothetical protein COSO111634_20110 [Corallococcus soli]
MRSNMSSGTPASSCFTRRCASPGEKRSAPSASTRDTAEDSKTMSASAMSVSSFRKGSLW